MHIIKISSASFKIILTKEDVEKYSKKYVLNDKIDSLGFFCEIKGKTHDLFDYPLDSMSVDAEFFMSKDGGGELFLTARPKQDVHNYCFMVKDSDVLYKMCKRVVKLGHILDSMLYFYEGFYVLDLCFDDTHIELSANVMSEYGSTFKITPAFSWYLQEHAKCIFCADAIQQIVKHLG